MLDNEKTKEQLLLEISYLKQVIFDLEKKYTAIEQFSRATEERFLNITSAVSDYIFSVHIVDGNPVETVHGPACYAITGYTPKEFYENPYLWINMVYPEDRPLVLDHVAKILSGKEVKPIEHRIIRKDGVIRWVRNTPVCQYDSEGKLKTYDGLIQDITEMKSAYDSLKLSEEKFAKAFRSSPDIITISTLNDGRFIDVNDAFVRETGYSRDEVIGVRSKELEIFADYNDRQEIVKELLSKGKVSNKELKIKKKNGEILTIFASIELIVMADEQCMITVARDIKDQKAIICSADVQLNLLKDNLTLLKAQLEELSEMLTDQFLHLCHADLLLFGINLTEFMSEGKPISRFVECLNERLSLSITLLTEYDEDLLLQKLDGLNEIILPVIFRTVEYIVSTAPNRSSNPIEINIHKLGIEIISPLSKKRLDSRYRSFVGREYSFDCLEYLLQQITKQNCDRLNISISYYYDVISCNIRIIEEKTCSRTTSKSPEHLLG